MTDPLLSRLLDSARHGLFLHDEAFRFISVNPAGAALLGYPQEALLEMTLSDIEPDFNRHGIQERLKSLRNGERLQANGKPRRSDGSTVAVEVMVTALETDSRRLYAVDVRPRIAGPHPTTTHRLRDMATALLASLQELQINRHEGLSPDSAVLEDLAGIAASLIVTANQASMPTAGWPDLCEVVSRYQARVSTLWHCPLVVSLPGHPVLVAVDLRVLEEALSHLLSTATETQRDTPLRCTVSSRDQTATLRLVSGIPEHLTALTIARQLLADTSSRLIFEGDDLLLVLPLMR